MFGNENIVVLALMVAVLAACGLAFVLCVRRKLPEQGFLALFLYLAILAFAYHSLYMPAKDRTRNSVRLLTEKVRDVPPTVPVFAYNFNSPALIFYMGRPVKPISGPADIPGGKDAIILFAENKRGGADVFRPFFPPPRTAIYDRDNYLVFVRSDGR
jgi:hypothetical protein